MYEIFQISTNLNDKSAKILKVDIARFFSNNLAIFHTVILVLIQYKEYDKIKQNMLNTGTFISIILP